VYRLVRSHPAAHQDLRFRSQLFDAASGGEANIAEGFYRYGGREFRQFLRYALASIAEAELRLKDGADRGHYPAEACSSALRAATHCRAVTIRLFNSLEPFTHGSPGKPR